MLKYTGALFSLLWRIMNTLPWFFLSVQNIISSVSIIEYKQDLKWDSELKMNLVIFLKEAHTNI